MKVRRVRYRASSINLLALVIFKIYKFPSDMRISADAEDASAKITVLIGSKNDLNCIFIFIFVHKFMIPKIQYEYLMSGHNLD